MLDRDAHDRRQILIDQLLRDANQVAYVHQLRREMAIISGWPEPDAETTLASTDFQPRPPRRHGPSRKSR